MRHHAAAVLGAMTAAVSFALWGPVLGVLFTVAVVVAVEQSATNWQAAPAAA